MARPAHVVQSQINKMQDLINAAREELDSPDTAAEDKAEIEQDIKDWQKKIQRLGGVIVNPLS
jgi:hypothetical protein